MISKLLPSAENVEYYVATAVGAAAVCAIGQSLEPIFRKYVGNIAEEAGKIAGDASTTLLSCVIDPGKIIDWLP